MSDRRGWSWNRRGWLRCAHQRKRQYAIDGRPPALNSCGGMTYRHFLIRFQEKFLRLDIRPSGLPDHAQVRIRPPNSVS
jgi:hypothetical protein